MQKTAICIRLDPDILEWFKSDGRGYQTRINTALREYMTAMTEDDVDIELEIGDE